MGHTPCHYNGLAPGRKEGRKEGRKGGRKEGREGGREGGREVAYGLEPKKKQTSKG